MTGIFLYEKVTLFFVGDSVRHVFDGIIHSLFFFG